MPAGPCTTTTTERVSPSAEASWAPGSSRPAVAHRNVGPPPDSLCERAAWGATAVTVSGSRTHL